MVGVDRANKDEEDSHRMARFFRRFILAYNQSAIQELQRVVTLRETLLKKTLFWLLKVHSEHC